MQLLKRQRQQWQESEFLVVDSFPLMIFFAVILVDVLKETFETISNILEKDFITTDELPEKSLNCSEFLLLIDEFKQVYIRTLQIDSLARGFVENRPGEKFVPEPSLLEEIYYSTNHIKQFNDPELRVAKTILGDGTECPSKAQVEEAGQLNGSLCV